MDLVKDYLDAVRPLLPGDQRDDIIEELDGVLRGRLEDKAGELGRKLTRKEEEAGLAAYGHPFLVAARYQPQHTLIGPELFPLWWLGARAAVALDVLLSVARAVAVFMTGPESDRLGERLGHIWGGFWSTGFMMIGALTIGVALVERFKLQPFGSWTQGSTDGIGASFRKTGRAPSRVESAGAVFGTLIGVVSWAALPWIQDWGPALFGRIMIAPLSILARGGVALGPIWFPTLWALLLVGSLFGLASHVWELVYPAERARALWLRIGSSAMGVVTGVVALVGGPLFVVTGPTGRVLADAIHLSAWVSMGIAVTTLMCAATIAWNLWRLRRLRSGAGQPQSKGAVTG